MQKVKPAEGSPENPWHVQAIEEYQRLHGGGGQQQEPTQEQIEAFKAALREEIERERREAEAAAEAAAAAEKVRAEAVERARLLMVQETVADNDTSRVTVRNFGSVVVDVMQLPPADGSDVRVSLKRKPAAGGVTPAAETGNLPPDRAQAAPPAFYAAAPEVAPGAGDTVTAVSVPKRPAGAGEIPPPPAPGVPAPEGVQAPPAAPPVGGVEGLRLVTPTRLTASESEALALVLDGAGQPPAAPHAPVIPGLPTAERKAVMPDGVTLPGTTQPAPTPGHDRPSALVAPAEASAESPSPAPAPAPVPAPAPAPVNLGPGFSAQNGPAPVAPPPVFAPGESAPVLPAPGFPEAHFLPEDAPPAQGNLYATEGADWPAPSALLAAPAPAPEAPAPEAPLAEFPTLAALIRGESLPATSTAIAFVPDAPATAESGAWPGGTAPVPGMPVGPYGDANVHVDAAPAPEAVDRPETTRDPEPEPPAPEALVPDVPMAEAIEVETPEAALPRTDADHAPVADVPEESRARVEAPEDWIVQDREPLPREGRPRSVPEPESPALREERAPREENEETVPMVQSGSDAPAPGFAAAEAPAEAPAARGYEVTHTSPAPEAEADPEEGTPVLAGARERDRGEEASDFWTRAETEWDVLDPDAGQEADERFLVRKAEEDLPPEAQPAVGAGPAPAVPLDLAGPVHIPPQYRDLPGGTPFTREILGLVSRVLVTADPYSDVQEVRLTFHEDVLPGTEIRFRTEGGVLKVELHAAAAESAEVLRQEAPGLKAALESGTGSEVEVTVIAGHESENSGGWA